MGQLWPLWVVIGFPLLLIVFEASPLAPNFAFVMMGIPALILVWAILGFWASVVSLNHLSQGDWRRALFCTTLPISILITIFFFRSFLIFCNDSGDLLHFAFCRPAYLREIQATPSNGQPRLVIINLGGMIWSSRGYVYDESDETMLAPSLQSPAWKARAQSTELSCGYSAQPFPGYLPATRHWYFASFSC
jgi:hypothetical protein